MNSKNRKAFIFVGLTFLLSYLLIFIYLALGGKWVMPGSLIVATTYMFIPMVVAIIVQRFMYRENLRESLGISFKFEKLH
jgi:uncharacterized protein